MKAIKTFKMKASTINLQIYAGLAMGILCTAAIILTSTSSLVFPQAASIFLFVQGLINKNRDSIKLFEDHMELKFAPTSALHLIKYQDLIRIEDKGNNAKKLYYQSSGKEKKTVIPLTQYNKEDMDEFFSFLESKMAV